MSEEKIVPYNAEAEQSVLGSILVDGHQITRIDLQSQDFFHDSHQAIYQAMLNLYRCSEGIDQITVAHELHRQGKLENIGGAAYLSHLISITPTSLHAPYYAKVIKECSLNRSLITAAGQIAQIGYQSGDPQQNLSDSQAILTNISKSIPTTRIWTPKDIADEADARYAKLRNTIPGIATGLTEFDQLTGGLANGDYVILASRPGVGKSTLALQVAQHIAHTHNVLFASLEMQPEAIMDKLVASIIEKPARLIRCGDYSDSLLDEITWSLGKLAQTNLYLCRGPATTASLGQLMERMKLSYGLDIAFVDYLQLLRDRYGSNANERIGFISGELTNISKELNIPLVVLSQLSRAPEARADKRPLLSDLRESGSIEQDADLVLFLTRESYYKKKIEKHGAPTDFLIAKDRMRGVSGQLTLYWDAHREKYVNTKEEVTGDTNQQLALGSEAVG